MCDTREESRWRLKWGSTSQQFYPLFCIAVRPGPLLPLTSSTCKHDEVHWNETGSFCAAHEECRVGSGGGSAESEGDQGLWGGGCSGSVLWPGWTVPTFLSVCWQQRFSAASICSFTYICCCNMHHSMPLGPPVLCQLMPVLVTLISLQVPHHHISLSSLLASRNTLASFRLQGWEEVGREEGTCTAVSPHQDRWVGSKLTCGFVAQHIAAAQCQLRCPHCFKVQGMPMHQRFCKSNPVTQVRILPLATVYGPVFLIDKEWRNVCMGVYVHECMCVCSIFITEGWQNIIALGKEHCKH